MNEILEEIFRINKLIRSLISEEDMAGIQNAINEKNQLIQNYNQFESDSKDLELMKRINELDQKNIENLNELMIKTKKNIHEIKLKKGQILNQKNKVKKYRGKSNNSGYRFDRKK